MELQAILALLCTVFAAIMIRDARHLIKDINDSKK